MLSRAVRALGKPITVNDSIKHEDSNMDSVRVWVTLSPTNVPAGIDYVFVNSWDAPDRDVARNFERAARNIVDICFARQAAEWMKQT